MVSNSAIATSDLSAEAASTGGELWSSVPPKEPATEIAWNRCCGCATSIAHRRKCLSSLLLRGEVETATSMVLLTQQSPASIDVPSAVMNVEKPGAVLLKSPV